MNVVTPTAADIEAFKAASSSVYDAYKEKAGAMGAQLLEAAVKILRIILAPQIGSRGSYFSINGGIMRTFIDLFERVTLLLAWFAAWLFVASGLMLSYEVVARYFFIAPTKWAAETLSTPA